MSTTQLENSIREVLARQAAALEPPEVGPNDAIVVVGSSSGGRAPRRRWPVLAAAAGLVVLAGVAFATRNPDGGSAVGTAPDGGYHYATPQVQLDAESIEVRTGGHTYVPPADVSVHSDPGTWDQYTTLELEWNAQGVPMRIYLYFASDGKDWWATELRTYDGSPGGEWIEMPGEQFRSPLGTAYRGDLDVQSLHIHGLTLQAFARPVACDATGPYALVPNESSIAGPVASLYGASVTLFDTATCAPASTDLVNVAISSDDPSIAAIDPLDVPSTPVGRIRVDLKFVGPGATTVHVAVSVRSTGALIDQVDIPVTVTADGSQTADTGLPTSVPTT